MSHSTDVLRKSIHRIVVCTVTLLAPLTVSAQNGNFSPATTYDAGGPCTNSIAVADVNADGKPDVIVAGGCPDINGQGLPGTVTVLSGNGDGTFKSPVKYYSLGVDAVAVQVADVNGDGKPDLVVANECSDDICATGTVGVLPGNGDGTFQSGAVVAYARDIFALVVRDVNSDGKPDIVLAQLHTVGVLLGNGNGTFQSVVSYSPGGLQTASVAIFDVNHDGRPDLVAADFCSDAFCNAGLVGVLLGNGDGTFRPVVTYNSGGPTTSIAIADVSGDGNPDVLAVNGTTSVGVLLGHGDGTFAPVVTYPSGAADAFSLALGDVSGDGKADLAVAHCSFPLKNGSACPHNSGVVGVLLGNGDGTFQAAKTHTSGGMVANSIAIADVNGDGLRDIVVGNRLGESNGDGTVGLLLHDNRNAHATSLSIASSLNPSFHGQPVSFTAAVTSAQGVIPNDEVVTFFDGATAIGTAETASGVATFTTAQLSVTKRIGHLISAVYSGDSQFKPSASTTLHQIVNLYPTETILVSNPNPSSHGQAVTFTTTVTSEGPTPTGMVKIFNGTTALKSVLLSEGKATFVTSKLPAGTNPMTAKYGGDSSHAKSVSAVLEQVVQ